MSIPNLSALKKNPCLRFPDGNDIGFYQDFGFRKGIPPNVDFYIDGYSDHNSTYTLRAKGYGVKEDYGAGCIMVRSADVGDGLRRAVGKAQEP